MENMIDVAFQDTCRAFARFVVDADIWAGITQTPEGIEEVAASIVSIIGGGAVFPPEMTSRLQQAAIEGYQERLQFLKSVSDRIGGAA